MTSPLRVSGKLKLGKSDPSSRIFDDTAMTHLDVRRPNTGYRNLLTPRESRPQPNPGRGGRRRHTGPANPLRGAPMGRVVQPRAAIRCEAFILPEKFRKPLPEPACDTLGRSRPLAAGGYSEHGPASNGDVKSPQPQS